MEFGEWVNAFNNDANVPQKEVMIGPNLALANWALEDVWNTPFLTDYANNLYALSVERLANFSAGGSVLLTSLQVSR